MVGGEERLTKLVRLCSAEPASTLLAAGIATRLSQLGYAAHVEETPWPHVDQYSALDFGQLKSSADAVLLIMPTRIGFHAAGIDGKYQPMITAMVTLHGKDRKQLLYRRSHACGWAPALGIGQKEIPCATTWAFADFDQMISQPRKPAEALAEAAAAVAASVAEDLKR